jgi:hypothetical protein
MIKIQNMAKVFVAAGLGVAIWAALPGLNVNLVARPHISSTSGTSLG